MENPPARQDPPLAEGRGQQRETDQNPSHGAARRGKLAFPPRFPTRPPPLLVLPLPSANPATPHYLCPPRPRPRAPGRIDGAGGAPIGRPRARAPRPRVRCARLPLGCLLATSEFCFAVADAVLIERFIRWHCFGAVRSLSWETYLPRIFASFVN